MDAIKAIMTRRSIRFFKKKKVSKALIEKIIDAGVVAPSSKNCKPWYYIILQGNKKNQLAELLKNELNGIRTTSWVDENIKVDTSEWEKSDPCFIFNKKGKTFSPTSSSFTPVIMKNAPVAILVFNKSPLSGSLSIVFKKRDISLLYAQVAESLSLGASIENMLIAINALGLDGVWIGDITDAGDFVKKYFKVKHELVGAIMFGYGSMKIVPRKIIKDSSAVKYY